MRSPVIFVHGIGTSGKVWREFDIPDRQAFYISFSNRFASPDRQVPELAGFIKEVLKRTKQEKVILVCHSMGGLVARRCLTDHLHDHHVEKLILLSTPNLGSIGLFFNWIPAALILIGLLGMPLLWPLVLALAGLIWEIVSYLRGVLLLSPASWAMRPNSEFLKELNHRELPGDIKYITILSDTKDIPHHLVNLLLFREGGDGAVPLSSQRLSARCVPNFRELDYSELGINLPHFAIPQRAEESILQALAL